MKTYRDSSVVRAPEGSDYYFGADLMPPPNAILVANTDDIVTRLWRRRAELFAFIISCTALALLLSVVQTQTYRSTATVEVQGLNDNILNTRDVDPTASSMPYAMEPYLQTQIKILQSESLIERVVDRLKLQNRPELVRHEGWLARIRRSVGLGGPVKKLQRQDLIDWATDSLSVRSPGQTRIIEISFEASDPKLAADFANTLVTEFNDRALESRGMSAQRTTEWLTSQLGELKSKVERSESEMQSYARTEGLLYAAEKDNLAEDRLRQLQESLSKAHEARVAQQSKYELVSTAPTDSLPEVLDDDVLKEYQMRLTELRRQLAEIRPVLAPGHYKVQQIQAQIAEMQNAVERERANILSSIKNQYDSAERREKILTDNYDGQVQLLSDQSQKAVKYSILKREVDTNRQLYEAMLQKVKEVGITAAANASNISLVDRAKAAKWPFRPKRAVYGAGGLGVGLFAGTAFALFPRRRQWRIDRTGDITRQLGIPELGSIPLIKAQTAPHPVELLSLHSKNHEVAECARAMLVSVLLGNRGAYDGRRPRMILISSCSAGEGRTTVAANLAVALAEANHRALLIDADLRNPRLHELFRIDNGHGISSILSETKSCDSYPLDQLGYSASVPKLYLLPSGPAEQRNPGLLHSGRAIEFVQKIRSAFDTIIIDTPPVLSFADARTLAKLSDGVVLVIRAGQTMPDEVTAALQRFAEDGTAVLGTVINGREAEPEGSVHRMGAAVKRPSPKRSLSIPYKRNA
jgi:polysaccharide biosynthesis transport protein